MLILLCLGGWGASPCTCLWVMLGGAACSTFSSSESPSPPSCVRGVWTDGLAVSTTPTAQCGRPACWSHGRPACWSQCWAARKGVVSPPGSGSRGVQSERCMLRQEAPSCTILAVCHASPRHSRCASCVKLSHDYRGSGAIWFDSQATSRWPRRRPRFPLDWLSPWLLSARTAQSCV